MNKSTIRRSLSRFLQNQFNGQKPVKYEVYSGDWRFPYQEAYKLFGEEIRIFAYCPLSGYSYGRVEIEFDEDFVNEWEGKMSTQKTRDWQKTRCYKAEWSLFRVFSSRNKKLTYNQSVEIVEEVCSAFNIPVCTVEFDNLSTRWNWYQHTEFGNIKMNPNGRRVYILLHELAHHIHRFYFKENVGDCSSHGRKFVAIASFLYNVYMGIPLVDIRFSHQAGKYKVHMYDSIFHQLHKEVAPWSNQIEFLN